MELSDTASNEQVENKLCNTAEQTMDAATLPLECNQRYVDLSIIFISFLVHVDFKIMIDCLHTKSVSHMS
jgi:hypothetical protein